MRFTSGFPETPVVGATYDADTDGYRPTRGRARTERLPAFFQVDLRIDKRWTFDTWRLDGTLDLLNATDRANSEQIRYNYDYSERAPVPGVPILPSLGVKGEF
jgi:hypothetical protein